MVEEEQFAVWARGIRASDQDAFTAFYHALRIPLLRYLSVLTHDQDVARDLLQEAFLGLWRIRARIDPEKSIKALLFQSARHLAYKHNHRRTVYNQRHMPLADQDGRTYTAEGALDAERIGILLRSWMADMPARRREVFQLSRIGAFSHAEIATLLDISPKTVNNHLVEALRFLRDRLRAHEIEV